MFEDSAFSCSSKTCSLAGMKAVPQFWRERWETELLAEEDRGRAIVAKPQDQAAG